MEVTLGGERLGAGKRNKVFMHNYERSTHDLSYIWRSTMATGTLVPFLSELALPGDTFDIELSCEILTHPTIGPLFGTQKVELHVFQVPIRLYQAGLHMNMLNIGMDMAQIKLPQIRITGQPLNPDENLDNQQINPSCIFSYLGMRGVGFDNTQPAISTTREFNAIPYLAYWDIYKNYFANKQEEQGAVIHKNVQPEGTVTLTTANLYNGFPTPVSIPINPTPPLTYTKVQITPNTQLNITGTGIDADEFQTQQLLLNVQLQTSQGLLEVVKDGNDLFSNWIINEPTQTVIASAPTQWLKDNYDNIAFGAIVYQINENQGQYDYEPAITFFPLENIDTMRMNLLQHPIATPYIITASNGGTPYTLPLSSATSGAGGTLQWSQQFSQEGLALKTYNSDLFNNWISTEWIDGADGISALTAVDTSSGSFTIDELNLHKKIYDMLNRIAISGGSYDDWLDAVYTHQRNRSAENPMYIGGLIKNIVFQEVIATAKTSAENPIGQLAGKGKMGNKHKGGNIVAKIDEPSYLIGLISITPNIDYSQGNKWDTNLKTMNDLHKPALDQIGFQDLITDQMAWWDTPIALGLPQFKSAGKQPAWINYMTNVNQVRGNFADPNEGFMVLTRRYEPIYDPTTGLRIADLTTYIDPVKFNHIFAQTSRDAQNYWAQVGVKMHARRKMSAKVMPNL